MDSDITKEITNSDSKIELNRSNKRAGDYILENIKTDFVINLSHELRTPLNIIVTSMQILLRELNDETKPIDREKFKNITQTSQKNCYRLIKLINNLIDVTKIETNYLTIDTANYNIVNIVEDISVSVAEIALIKDIKLIFDTEIEECIIAIDPDAIERVLLNLFSNALKFTHKGGSIFVNMSKNNDNQVIIAVTDTGIGIDAEDTSIIFERFKQIDTAFNRKNEGSGMGMGLLLAKSFVELHGGTIDVISEPGQGASFIIKLPIRQVSEEEDRRVRLLKAFKNNTIEGLDIEFLDI